MEENVTATDSTIPSIRPTSKTMSLLVRKEGPVEQFFAEIIWCFQKIRVAYLAGVSSKYTLC